MSSKIKAKMAIIGLMISCILMCLWVLNIIWLFYLGISTGDWLSDEFFLWEFISMGLCFPALILARISYEFMDGGIFNR